MKSEDVSKNLIISILNNFGYKISEIENIGKVIELNPKDGLLYSIITGQGYLDKNMFNYLNIITRDFFRIFNQIDGYNFQNGLFTFNKKIEPFNSLINISKTVSYLKNHQKYILPLEINSYSCLKKKCKEIIDMSEKINFDFNNIIICPVLYRNKSLSEFEPFIEYIIVNHYSKLNYITDTQIPFIYGKGTPDALAFKNYQLLNLLNKYGFFKGGGNIIELMFPSLFGFVTGNSILNNIEDEFIVFEVKTGATRASEQIEKYLSTKYFDIGVEAKPFLQNNRLKSFFTFDKSGKIIKKIMKEKKYRTNEQHIKYITWLNNYIKYYILANLGKEEFLDFNETVLGGCEKKGDFIREINGMGLENLIKIIINYK